MGSDKLNTILNTWGILFFVGVFAAAFIGYKEVIPDYMLVMHVVIALLYYMGLKYCVNHTNITTVLSITLIYFTFISFLLRYLFWEYTGDPFADTIGCDSYRYERYALQLKDYDFIDYIRRVLKLPASKIDDLGYTSVVYLTTKWFGDIGVARNVILVINVFAITVSTYLIYKLCILLNISRNIASFSAAVYGMFPFFVVFSAMGLKENIFCLMITASLYYMYKYKNDKRFSSLLAAVVFIASTYLFRFAVCLMLCVVFIASLYVNEHNRKSVWIVVLVACAIGVAFLEVIIYNFSNIEMEYIYVTAEKRMEESVGLGTTGWLIESVAAAFGPFPNFTYAVQYGIYHSAGLLLKSIFLNLFACAGIVYVIKRFDYRYYPLVLYLIMGIFMLLGTGFSLDMRFHVTFFPALMVLVAYALDTVKIRNVILWGYCACMCVVIALYNLR
ncbi:MAG: glycosyltransferase family 39 protein [Alistipes sp.]|nr:glycosyltransferase family 39 protein [Alistipes sp.]